VLGKNNVLFFPKKRKKNANNLNGNISPKINALILANALVRKNERALKVTFAADFSPLCLKCPSCLNVPKKVGGVSSEKNTDLSKDKSGFIGR